MHYEVDYTGVVKDKKTEDKDKVKNVIMVLSPMCCQLESEHCLSCT